MADSALSTADYQVLVVLSETAGGVLRAGELGRATGWEKSRLSHHSSGWRRAAGASGRIA